MSALVMTTTPSRVRVFSNNMNYQRLRLLTFGQFRCFRDREQVTDLPRQRLRSALMLYLAVKRETARQAVQYMFWSERTEEKGRGALKQNIYELHKTFGPDCLYSQGNH